MSSGKAPDAVREVRKACRQFAMLYFHFCQTLYEVSGETAAMRTVQKALLAMSRDRATQLRTAALEAGIPLTPEGFSQVTDIPVCGWTPTEGEVLCPYAETWLVYIAEYPWFAPFASLYCDVIDTTNIEVFSGDTTHRITHNLLWGDAYCDRIYEPSEAVAQGRLTYEVESD